MKLRQVLKTFAIDEKSSSDKKLNDNISKGYISEEEFKEDTAFSKSIKTNVILSTDIDIPAQNYITNDSVSFY